MSAGFVDQRRTAKTKKKEKKRRKKVTDMQLTLLIRGLTLKNKQ